MMKKTKSRGLPNQCCQMLVKMTVQCPHKTSPNNSKLAQITAQNLR